MPVIKSVEQSLQIGSNGKLCRSSNRLITSLKDRSCDSGPRSKIDMTVSNWDLNWLTLSAVGSSGHGIVSVAYSHSETGAGKLFLIFNASKLAIRGSQSRAILSILTSILVLKIGPESRFC